MAFIKISGLPRYQRLPKPLQGEFTGAHLWLPSPELAPSGVELPGLGAEKGKKQKEELFFFCRHALAGGYFTANFSTRHVIPPFITKFCWGKPKGPS